MTTSPALSVSIVTFRTDIALLKEALASLKKCALPMAVVIADNTPEPEYFERLKTLEGVQCLRSRRNNGYGSGHNLALTACAEAPYHLVMNPDVVVHAGCIETLVAMMEKESDIAIAVPKTLNDDGTLQPLNKHDPNVLDLALRRFLPASLRAWAAIRRRLDRFVMRDVGYDAPCDVPFASGCFMLFRRSAFDKLGGFDERFFMYFEDADISRRARAIGRVRFCPDAVITHRWKGGARTSLRLTFAMLASAFRYFQKWGWRWR